MSLYGQHDALQQDLSFFTRKKYQQQKTTTCFDQGSRPSNFRPDWALRDENGGTLYVMKTGSRPGSQRPRKVGPGRYWRGGFAGVLGGVS